MSLPPNNKMLYANSPQENTPKEHLDELEQQHQQGKKKFQQKSLQNQN